MKARRQNETQENAAIKAGISERSGRAIEQDKRTDPITEKPEIHYTRIFRLF